MKKSVTKWVYEREVITDKAVHRYRAGYNSVYGWGVAYSVLDARHPDWLPISWDGYPTEDEARYRVDTKAENKAKTVL